MIIERLSREHRNIEKLLAVLEREIEIFDRGTAPTMKSFAGLFTISNSILSCTTIRKKNWCLPS